MTNISNQQLKVVQEKVKDLSEKSKKIHVTVHQKRNPIIEAPSIITGVYERFLCVESRVNNYVEKFTINYIDLITNYVVIKEL